MTLFDEIFAKVFAFKMRETFEKDPLHVSDLYGPRISEWRDRELQLSRLHEEM